MERLDVLEANTHSGLQILSSSPKVVFLTSIFSNAASTIRSQSAHRSSFRPGVILATIASTASWVIFPFSTSLAYPFTILALPPSAHSCLISQRATSYPSTWANAFAMPCPMVPAPIIPTFMVNPPVFPYILSLFVTIYFGKALLLFPCSCQGRKPCHTSDLLFRSSLRTASLR